MKKINSDKNSGASLFIRQVSISCAIAAFTVLSAAHADDIEALVSAPKEANILFVLDVSGSMGTTKLGQMQDAITTIIDSQTTNPNIGFTYFGGPEGSGIKWPVSAIEGEAHDIDSLIPANTSNGQVVKNMADALKSGGWTPSTDAMLEAAVYFRGETPVKGNKDTFGEWDDDASPPQYTGGSSNSWPNRRDGQRAANPITYTTEEIDGEDVNSYISPIGECQANAIIFLSDGAPTKNTTIDEAEALIASATGAESYSCENIDGLPSQGKCAPDIAKFLYDNNQISNISGSNVRTYSIGFHLSRDSSATRFLRTLASYGGGDAYSADNASSLVAAIESILNDISRGSKTFTGVSTNVQRNSLKTSNKTFLPLFEPSLRAAWEGNIKGYFLNAGVLVDINGNVATETGTSGLTFKDTAQSFWSNAADGTDLLAGGLRNNLVPDSRNMYVITSPDENEDITLADDAHDLDASNTAFRSRYTRSAARLLGLPGNASHNDVINTIEWIRSARMGDPLHSRPQVINYGGTTGDVLFVATNQGLLHAFNINSPTAYDDTSGGDEIFAFMPYESLSEQHRARSNPISDEHVYGIDGDLRFWVRDLDSNGIIDGDDKVYLYFGMRRGGSVYYGMDVTNPADPKVMWKIKAGSLHFRKLGQTWSAPTIVKVKNRRSERTVLVFGGGYDTGQDARGAARNNAGDNLGMGIYIVDPLTGARLNSIGNSSRFRVQVEGMKYAVPSEIRVIDTNADGYADRMYFGDMGGNVWRVDIDERLAINNASALSGYKLASLSGDTAATNRRLYYPPAVAYAYHNGSKKMAIAIGSGYRAHPLDSTIADRMHLIYDGNIETGKPDTTPEVIAATDLLDITTNLIQEGETADIRAETIDALNAADGWRLNLGSGEKSLSSPLIFNNKLLFTTFSQGNSVLCGLNGTTNRYYAINLGDGTPLETLPDPETGNHNRSILLSDETYSIAPTPQIIYYDKPIDPENTDKGNQGCAGFLAGLSSNNESCAGPRKVFWKETK